MFSYIKCLVNRNACQIDIPARLVYAYLIYRDRIGQGANLTELRDNLQMKYSVPPALEQLSGFGLVRERDGIYFAVEPPEHVLLWFIPKKKEVADVKHWSQRYMGFPWWLPTPENRLTTIQKYVYFLTRDWVRQEKVIKAVVFAKILNVDKRSIKTALVTLRDYGMIKYMEERGEYIVELQELLDMKDWWKTDKPKPEPYPWTEEIKEWRARGAKPITLKRITMVLNEYLARGYPPTHTPTYNNNVWDIFCSIRNDVYDGCIRNGDGVKEAVEAFWKMLDSTQKYSKRHRVPLTYFSPRPISF